MSSILNVLLPFLLFQIPVVNLEFYYLMILFSQMCCGAAFVQGVYIILTGGCGRNGSTVAVSLATFRS